MTHARVGTRRRSPRLTVLVSLAALAAVACGPRFDRAELTVSGDVGGGVVAAPIDGGSGGETDGGTTIDDGATIDSGGDFDDSGDPGTDGGVSGSDGAAGPGTSGGATVDPGPSGSDGSDGGSTPSQPGQPSQPAQPATDPGPAPGVTDEVIKVVYLVPLSGAAPIPTSWDEGAKLYWDVNDVAGRRVEIKIYDTESNTSTAVQKARQAVTQDKAFTIITLDRLEVQAAVANELEARNFPHIMIQSPTPAPAAWKNTFTVSIDHTVQGKAVARFFSKDLASKGKKVGVVREQTNALKPGTDAFVAEAKSLGLDVVAVETINPQSNQYQQTVLSLQQAGAEIVWLYMAPQPAITIINQSGGYAPTWFANSISWNFDLIHPLTPNLDGRAFAFSPWVPLTNPRANAYKAAYRKQLDKEPDDIGLVGWGVGEVVDAALTAAGENLGHDAFRASMRTFKANTQVWAPLDFSGGGSVGANQVAVYQTKGGTWTSFGGDFRRF